MHLDPDIARQRLVDGDHGVLATRHPTRGADAVPVVYTVVGDHVGIPIDRVKPKASARLQREHNLAEDPRATLLIEHWDRDDWSQLWWVRADLSWTPAPEPALIDALAERLATSFTQYEGRPFHSMLVLSLEGISGWSAR